MKLHWLKLNNFRQFYGTSPKIEFSHGDQNVTVVHGYNGAGKTAILNAFTWLLYGEFTAGFQQTESLVNKRAIREAEANDQVEAFVEMKFDHIGKQYLVRKSYRVTKANSDTSFTNPETIGPEMQWCDSDGQWREETSPDDVIGQILPQDLHFYFFFDGERIEKFFNPTYRDKKSMAEALKEFLGIEPFERAERHLKRVEKHFEKELQKIGDSETKRILEDKENLENTLEKLLRKKRNKEDDIEAERAQKERIEKQLRDHAEAADLQEERDILSDKLRKLSDGEKDLKKELASHLSSKGYVVFLRDVCENYHELEDRLRKAGELPSGIKKQFVEDLLESGKCICGNRLPEGSEARATLEQWLNRAGLAEVEERLLQLGGFVTDIESSQITEFLHTYNDIISKISDRRERRSALERELESIHESLKASPDINVRDLEDRQKKASDNIEDFIHQSGRISKEIETTQNSIEKLENDLDKKREKQEKSELAKRRLRISKEARKTLGDMRESLEWNNVQLIDKKLKKHFKEMTYAPYIPKLDPDDFTISLLESAGGEPAPVAASQGECQLMSFAFLSTIIDHAREWQAKKENSLHHLDSSKYPIVMDSPFGSLDPYYRKQVSMHVPQLADQVVILVTPTQWRGEVEEQLNNRVGKEYILEYHSPEDNIPDESISISGTSYPLIRKSVNNFEYTKVVEVKDGR